MGDSEAIPDSLAVFFLIHISALITIGLSMVGSLFIVYCYHMKQRNQKRSNVKKNIGHRLPYYLSIFDLCWSTTHSLDHLLIVIHQEPINPRLCAFFGSMLQLFLAMQLLMLFFIALYAYLLVCREMDVKIGAYDWKLLIACFGNAAMLMIIGNGVGAYGADRYWCYIDVSAHKIEVILLLVVPVWSVFLGCAVLYHRVYLKTKQVMVWHGKKKWNDKKRESAANASAVSLGRARYQSNSETCVTIDAPASPSEAVGSNRNAISPTTPSISAMTATSTRSTIAGEVLLLPATVHTTGSSAPSSPTNSLAASCAHTSASSASCASNPHIRVVRRMMVYIGIFIYQYIVAMIAFTILVAGFEHWILRFIVVITINIGGFLNAIAYGRAMRANRNRSTSQCDSSQTGTSRITTTQRNTIADKSSDRSCDINPTTKCVRAPLAKPECNVV